MIAQPIMNDETVIQRLGGAKVVGDELRARGVKVEDVTVRSWTLPGRSIPSRYWMHVAAIAAAKKAPITLETLAQAAAA